MLRKTHAVLLILVIAIAAIGCRKGSAITAKPKPVRVDVTQVKRCQTSDLIAYSGTIEESESIPLSFTVTGRVQKIYVAEGDYVQKGTLLAVLNNETLTETYNISKATFNRALDAHKRLEPMYRNGNLPEIRFIEAQTALQQARSAMAIAKKNVGDCRLFSPTDGYVGKRSIEPGMAVIPSLSAITIVKIDNVLAKVPVAESEISLIEKGQDASITVGALNSKTFQGTVEEIGVMANPLSRTYTVKIKIFNQEKKLKPGMICEVVIQNSGALDGFVIPSQSVWIDEKGNTFVYKLSKDLSTAVLQEIKTGKLLKDGVIVTKGLNENDFVVVGGQHKLCDGQIVSIAKGLK
jgi:RND family efflux transporter MFP subunit